MFKGYSGSNLFRQLGLKTPLSSGILFKEYFKQKRNKNNIFCSVPANSWEIYFQTLHVAKPTIVVSPHVDLENLPTWLPITLTEVETNLQTKIMESSRVGHDFSRANIEPSHMASLDQCNGNLRLLAMHLSKHAQLASSLGSLQRMER